MKKGLIVAALFCLASPFTAQAQQRFPQADVDHGRYLATAGDCAACHDTPGTGAMAGGYPIVSPLGTIYSSNITPSRTHGIGDYSEAQFARALREGVRADGARLYPAMPFPSYAGLTDADVHALYAYFMQGVAPVDRSPPKTRLPFPFNLRLSMMGWNMLFLSKGVVTPDPAHDAQWNRGRYLAETLGHCSTCHSPRGLLMQESKSAALGGSPLGAWYAPNITSDKVSGIGGWSKTEIAQYLSTGHVNGKAQAAGDMADAVTNSFSRMTPTDIDAIATFIATVPAVHDAEAKQASYASGAPGHFEAGLRGSADASKGAHLYSGLCASCHGRDGAGTADETLPSLFHNSTVGATRPDNLVAVILHGVDRTVGDHHVLMPGFGEKSFVQPLSDEQIATLATFVRQSFGPGDAVSVAQVATARKGGRSSFLLPIARIGLTVMAVLLVGIALWILRRRARRPI
jgi:mono/diheme cytochrome c family protein